jgi:AcrR family transcriptional regulator
MPACRSEARDPSCATVVGQRARSASDKETRRRDLLDAAEAMLAARPYESLTTAEVAEAAGLSKASAYTYFPTKESLFLALLERSLERWLQSLETGLGRRARTPRALARRLADSVASEAGMRALLGRLHSTLESNVPDAGILAFKRFLATIVGRGGALVEAALPTLPRGAGPRVMLTLHALVIGVGSLSSRSANVERALAPDPALARQFEVDFASELAALLEVILTGWCTQRAANDS